MGNVTSHLKSLPLLLPCFDGLWPGTVSPINPFPFKLLLLTYFITAAGKETKVVLSFCAVINFPLSMSFPELKPSRFSVLCQLLHIAGATWTTMVGWFVQFREESGMILIRTKYVTSMFHSLLKSHLFIQCVHEEVR